MVIALVLLFCSGCSSFSDDSYLAGCCEDVPYLSNLFNYPTKTLQISVDEKCNGCTPVYLLIKTSDFPHFIADDYQKMANEMAAPPEESTLAHLCLLPGSHKMLKVPFPEGEPIAFYALYTHPGPAWKTIVEPSEPFKRVELQLGEAEIVSVELK